MSWLLHCDDDDDDCYPHSPLPGCLRSWATHQLPTMLNFTFLLRKPEATIAPASGAGCDPFMHSTNT